MTQLVLPNTIDAGTSVDAPEVQSNFDAIKTVLNGQIEGGTSVDSNVKAKGLTMRELDRAALAYAGMTGSRQAGVFASTDLAITPGAGLQLNYAAGRGLVSDDGSVHTSGLLIPANVASGGTVTIGANASGNPRIDQVVLTLTGLDAGSVSVLQGTATAGATLANRTGAAALPAKTLRLADVLVTNGFAGPFVVGTSLIDRRPWAGGAYGRRTWSGSQVMGGLSYLLPLRQRIEVSGLWPVRISLTLWMNTTTSGSIQLDIKDVNTNQPLDLNAGGLIVVSNPGGTLIFDRTVDTQPAAGSQLYDVAIGQSGPTMTATAASFRIHELVGVGGTNGTV